MEINHIEIKALLEILENRLEEGDILFTSIPHFLYKAIERGTHSPTSHVGIAIKRNGNWMVAESKVPYSRLSTLENFISRSNNYWVSVKRLKAPLSQAQKQSLRDFCKKHLGKRYDFGFNYHSKRMFCSKYVYDAYLQVCDIKVGELERVETLMEHCPSEDIAFWRLWFCGLIPKRNYTITPHSQYIDKQLQEVSIPDGHPI